MSSSLTRNQELAAREILMHPDQLGVALKERRWMDVAALVTFIKESEHNHDLAMTDPALYRTLREAITIFYLRGGGALNLEKLRLLAQPIS